MKDKVEWIVQIICTILILGIVIVSWLILPAFSPYIPHAWLGALFLTGFAALGFVALWETEIHNWLQ